MKRNPLIITIALAVALVAVLAVMAHAAKASKYPLVTIQTDKGTFVMELRPDDAPIAAANFAKLVKKKFYDGLTFHRYVPNFVIQGGDPEGTGQGGPGYSIKDEINKTLKHVKGAVGMAKSSMPNSAGSQFYVCLNDLPDLDGRYTVFAKVVKGMDVVEKLRVGDKMIKVTIAEPKSTKPAPKKK